MRSPALAALIVLAGVTLTGCASSVAKADVEDQISTQLEGEFESPPEDVSCPGDLAAEKGETVTCTMTADGTEYDVDVEVTSVEDDGTVNFDLLWAPA